MRRSGPRETRAPSRTRAALALACLVAASALAGCESGTRGSYMSIGTGNAGGVYYPVGGALASRLTQLDPDRQYTAEVTGASVENVKRIEQGQIDLGFSLTTTVVSAFDGGTELFPEPIADLRIVAPVWPNPVNIVVPPDSDIRTLADIRGRRVSVGAAGSGTEQVSRVLLGAYGMSYDDIDERFLSFTESAAGIRDRSLDLAVMEVAHPASAVMEVTTTGDARLLPIEGPEIDALLLERPYFFAYTIPAGAYRGVDADIRTIAEANWIVARESLDADVVRLLLDILAQERDRFIQVNEVVRQIDLDDLRRAPIPLHPAAAAWMDENL